MSDLTDLLAEAQAQRAADLDALAELDDDQVDYLARLDEVHDPLTDGIECDYEEHV